MSNLRKRNLKSSQNGETTDPPTSSFKKVCFAVEHLVFNKRNKKDKMHRMEEMSVWPYLVAFVFFLIFAVYFIDYLHHWESGVEDDSVLQTQNYAKRFVQIACSSDYGKDFKSCRPKKCGRAVRDDLFSMEDLKGMREIAEKGMKYGGGNGGATILDLHSGALSYRDQFINLHAAKKVFSQPDFDTYSRIRNKIQDTIAEEFNIDRNLLYLTKPTFFSRLTNKPASTKHDEYWHHHIDRITYGTFYYTSLLYLSDYDIDFTGGRFMFVDQNVNKTVEPKFGRLSFFTSGSENVHFVERVESGTRYAVTVSFTCDKKHRIKDPSIK